MGRPFVPVRGTGGGKGSNQRATQACPCGVYLIRTLDLVGSPCSISDFFSAKIFLMVLASWDTSASQTHPSSVGQRHAQQPQGGAHLKHLGARLVVSLGIFNQQFHVFSHGANAAVVAQLDGRHRSKSFITKRKNKLGYWVETKANLDLLCDDFQIYGFLNDGVIIRVLLHANTQTNKK